MFQNIFSFDGRIRRTEYGLTILFAWGIQFVLISASEFLIILYLPVMYICFAQGAKRCHDLGKNAWWQLIPFYGLFMLFQEGQQGPNIYGLNPKEINISQHE